jgi:hypothetical protein
MFLVALLSLRQLVSAFAVSPDTSLKTPVFPPRPELISRPGSGASESP